MSDTNLPKYNNFENLDDNIEEDSLLNELGLNNVINDNMTPLKITT